MRARVAEEPVRLSRREGATPKSVGHPGLGLSTGEPGGAAWRSRISRLGTSLMPPGLRLPRHRATTAHLCSAYPVQAGAGLGGYGVYLGRDELAGGAAFCFDPFAAYTQRIVDSPNMLVFGVPRSGKSSAVKTFLYRSVGVLRSPSGLPRWCAVCDPKGEYRLLAEALGLDVVRLHPGGTTRLNPLEAGPAGAWASPQELIARRSNMLTALLGAVVGRELDELEDAAVGWAVERLSVLADHEPTLADVAQLLAHPTAEMVARDPMGRTADELARGAERLLLGLGKLLDRSLSGMFDGRSTVRMNWGGRGLVLDLSAVYHDPAALKLVMIAATGWLQAALAAPEGETTPRRLQVLDEAWALLAEERTARYLQACCKLCSTYGVANISICHRISDLRSQADDGTATAKIALGLLADADTRVLFRQASDQANEAAELLQLTAREAELLTRLVKGRALWKVGQHTAVVQHVIASAEREFCDTDSRLVV